MKHSLTGLQQLSKMCVEFTFTCECYVAVPALPAAHFMWWQTRQLLSNSAENNFAGFSRKCKDETSPPSELKGHVHHIWNTLDFIKMRTGIFWNYECTQLGHWQLHVASFSPHQSLVYVSRVKMTLTMNSSADQRFQTHPAVCKNVSVNSCWSSIDLIRISF